MGVRGQTAGRVANRLRIRWAASLIEYPVVGGKKDAPYVGKMTTWFIDGYY